MRVLVDMDGVLCDLITPMLQGWHETGGPLYAASDVTDWDLKKIFKHPNAGGWITEFLSRPALFPSLKPLSGAIDGLLRLQTAGHQVLIVTHVSRDVTNAFDGKRQWVSTHIPWFDLHDLCFCTRKEIIDGDVLIDDARHNIEAWTGEGKTAIIMDQPWNRGMGEVGFGWDTRDGLRNAHRPYDWRDVQHIVEQLDYERYNRERNARR